MKAFPGFDSLFSLHDPMGTRPFRGGFSRVSDSEALLRGEVKTADPVDVPWFMGGKVPGDVIWTGAANVVVLSQRVIDLLLVHNLTGWSTYPVRVTGESVEEFPGFYGLAITGRCGPVDYARSEVVLHQYPGGWFPHLEGSYFDEASWDGSDFFMERPDAAGQTTAMKFVTQAVVQVLRRAKVRNLDSRRLSEADVNLSAIEIGLAHRLPRDIKLRVARAHAGEPVVGADAPRRSN